MLITLTHAQFAELKKLIPIVKEAQSQGAATGEATNATNSVEWTATEVKFTIA